jgi:hypothetical protein
LQGPREYRSLSDVRAALREGAGGRLDRIDQPCLFDRIDWLESLHRRCLSDMPVRVIEAREGNSSGWLFLFAPQTRRLSALANWYSFSWAPIFSGAPDAAARRRLLDSMATHLLRDTAQIDLYPVRDDMAAMLLAAFRNAGWLAVRRPMGGNYRLDLNGRDFASWWAERPGPLRTLVRRKARGGIVLRLTDHMRDADWSAYVSVHDRSWKAPEPNIAFFRDLAEREGAAGTLRLGFAERDGQVIATQLWTVENGVALIHKLAHNKAFDAASPGTLLSHAMFAQAIDGDRVATIDYGTGDNGYKRAWMDARVPLHRIDCFNPRFASSWIPAARTVISALVG